MSTPKNEFVKIGVIILAAGGSSRLGRPKQLLRYNENTLLQHTVQAALDSKSDPVIVVLGAEAETVKGGITSQHVHQVFNAEWKEGMASSIRSGMKALAEISPSAEGVILMVCDQPYVTASLLNELVSAHLKTGKTVVACSYENTFGPPVFFHRSLFEALLQLEGDIGARSLVRKHADSVELVPFEGGSLDVDTEDDYQRIKSAGTT